MTCKDCVHENVCNKLCPKGLLPYKSNKYPAEKFCLEFTSKSDYVEVVKCKDCKHWNERENECKNDYVVTDNEGGASFSLNFYLDDFCSYGERRTDNDL